jgi:hypothetical protein
MLRQLVTGAVLAVALAAPAGAANRACPNGFLTQPTGQPTSGISVDIFTARAAPAVVVQAVALTGTATVQVEMCCSPLDCTLNASWAPVTGSVMTLAGATPSAVVSMLYPTCLYRSNVTACTTCGVVVAFSCAGP